MLPPTVFNLLEVARFATAAEVLAAAADRVLRPIQPVLRQQPDGTYSADLGDGTLLPLPAGFIAIKPDASVMP